MDPLEIIERRAQQKMALARYARQSLLQWDDVEVIEIARWCRLLRELLEREGESEKLQE